MSSVQPLRTIRLLGDLGRQFGREHRLAVKTPAEALRALCVLRPGFRAYVDTHDRHFRVLVRDGAVTDHERELHMQHGPDAEFTVAPILAGSKSKWAGIILGAALIAFALTNPFGWAAMSLGTTTLGSVAFGMGASLVLSGIAQMLAPAPKADAPSDKPSYLFNGPVSTSQQGYPVPVGYGELVVGGAVISAGSWSEDLPK